MSTRSLGITDELQAYLEAHGSPPDDVAAGLIAETQANLGRAAGMQIAPDQAAFLTLLVRLLDARHAVEVGTFTGYSSLAIARGLAPDGRLLCCDISDEWTSIGRPYWARAGVADRIELRIAPAIETLRALPTEPYLDFAFIDADKEGYVAYWEELVPRLRTGGLVAVDNVLWSGRVADPSNNDPTVQAIRAFNDHAAADKRVDVVMLPIADGLTLAQKR